MNREQLFVDTPGGGRLAGLQCRACGRTSFPVRPHCPYCLEETEVEPTALSPRGRLFAFTIAEVGVPAIEAPYAFGFVDLPEGVRVFALLDAGRSPEHVAEGAEMEVVVPAEGEMYRFVPVAR
jgi:uncharacterized OB-fold protein